MEEKQGERVILLNVTSETLVMLLITTDIRHSYKSQINF